ncbi:DUF11 domain-containing protein [Microbispora cellulosiformans]|uniref:DUF11 domain-containing protein n=1 Tax=Microbispora cellulosiformans TaxID=2614688 RepID=A0A5J5JWP8_9ACTN|nr:DUF11 domain-containing protein [Microbispora cellulosiformans]KAA9376116.1 DUF11 domain-containing protein [Microbispora cellulosiformans]
MRLRQQSRTDGDRVDVTVLIANTGREDAKAAGFTEDLSGVPGQAVVGEAQASGGALSFHKPMLRWTGDLPAGDSVTVRYAIKKPAKQATIPMVDTTAGRTCRDMAPSAEAAGASGTAIGEATSTAVPADAQPVTAAATAPTTKAPTPGATPGTASGPASDEGMAAERRPARRGSAAETATASGPESLRRTSKALLAPVPFSQRYLGNYRGAVTRVANAVVTCYPPAVSDCATRRNGVGNNNVAAAYVDVDSDASTFDSSTADLTLTAGAQVAYARLYWGGRGQTTTDTPGLPANNRFAPNIAQRGQVLIKVPGASGYQTISAAAADVGDTPDNVTASGIVYGASADVTSLVAAAGAGTYTVANVQASQGFDNLGAFGGWTLVVAYRDPSLPLRNIAVFDGFLNQQNNTPATTITLSGFQTPTTGPVNVTLGEVALDGDNAIVGDSLAVKSTNGPQTTLSDALHPADNFFNSTIATLGSQVTNRNPAYTNTLGYDSSVIDASSAFRNNDTSAQFTFSTVGDSYWPSAFFTQIDLHQANIQVSKSAQVVGGGTPAPGSTVEYTLTATNTGDDNSINTILTDPIPAGATYSPGTIVVASGPNAGPKTDAVGDDQGEFVGNQVQVQLGTGATPFAGGTLAPGQSTSVTFRVVLTPASGGTTVTNTGTVGYASADTPTQPGQSSGSGSIVVPAQISSLALLKTASPGTVSSAGQTVTYSFRVTNTGNTTLTGVSAVDTLFSGTGTPPVISCPVTTLTPGASTTCTGTYTVTQADIDAGTIVNTATASGTPPFGPAVTSNPSTATVNAPRNAQLALQKTAFPNTVSAAGRTITYSLLVTNTGNTTLTGVTAADTAFSGTGTPPVFSCPVATLVPGASTTCTGTYTVTQADIDAGSIVNTAVASGTPPTGPAISSNPSTVTVAAPRNAQVALLKTASPSTVSAAGQTVTYSYLVTNIGNTTLTGVSAVDTAFSGTGTPPVISCPVTTLVPSASTTCTGTYTVTQADIDAGSIVNTATASGTPPTGPAVTSSPSTATVNASRNAQVALLKTASPGTVSAAGQTVTYSYLVTNTGNTTLTGVSAVDTAFSGTGTPPVITCPVTNLTPGALTTCTGTYTVTQADIDAGSIVNTATASGTPPTGPAVTSNPSTATVNASRNAQVALLKTASPGTVSAAGRTITYSFLVTNTGNTTLTGVNAVDTAFSGTGTPPVITCPVTTLTPSASTTCTGTYVTTQADIDAGAIVNTATASGTPPSGPAVTSNPSTATVTAPSTSQLALLKTASPGTVSAAGQTVTYSFLVTNTGNTTLTGVTAEDTSFSGTGTPPVITCPVTTLTPAASTTCTGSYTVTQADIDAGAVVNTATASGTPPTGPAVTSNPSTATVNAPRNAQLALQKTAFPNTVSVTGRTIVYSLLVTNTGNATLTGVTAVDTSFSGSGTPPVFSCPVSTLAPGASTTCTGTYVTTQADIDAGAIVNTAVASGTPPSGPAISSNPSTATVTAPRNAQLALQKTASPTTVSAAGQTVAYSYLVTNTGNTTLTGVTAADTSFSGSGTPPVITCPVTTLTPSASTTCSGSYTVTQADIDAGAIVNTATASGAPPTGPAVTSNPSTATVTSAAAPGLALQKTPSQTSVPVAGRTIVYSYHITNTGNTTLTGVTATDTSFSGTGTPPVITCPVSTLTPGATTTCTGPYTVTQADIDAGSIVNTAVATGNPPSGPAVTSNPSTATVTAPRDAQLALLKTAFPSSMSEAGQVITYSFRVTNTGNTTLTGVNAVDTAFSGSGTPPVITCPVTTLVPAASTTCTGTYTVTQADIDAGAIVNTAVATGNPPSGPAVTSNPSTATVSSTAAPGLSLLKTAFPTTVFVAGRTVVYSFAIVNTGDVTLTGVTVADTAFSGTGTPPVITCPVTTLAPDESTTCTGTYTATQADIDAGSIVNTAVATGTPPTGPAVSSNPSTATVNTPPDPQVALLKTASPSTVTAAGQTVTYSYLVTNTGNTTLTGVSAVDTAFSGSGTPPVITCPVTTLVPTASTTCTGTYTVTQADIDAGSVVNTATASGTPPTGPAVTSSPSTATVNAPRNAQLALQKTPSQTSVPAAGRVIVYSYHVTNTGNTTLTGVTATDTFFSGTGTPPVITCPVTTLVPTASTTCTGSYTVTQADIDAGSIVNTAVATGTPPTGPAVASNPSTATVIAPPTPQVVLQKTANPSTVSSAGQTVTYSYLVTNVGNTTLTGVTAVDTSFSGTGTPPVITCPVTTLAPQTSTTCTGSYTVTQADIDAGSIVNTATASGTPPEGPAVTSNPSTATVTSAAAPGLALQKTAFPSTIPAAGRTITYSFAIVNTGDTTLTGVTAVDTFFSGTGTPPVVTCPVTTLAPDASTTCTGTYVTTQADIDAGSVVNTAVASGTPPTGPAVDSNPSTATVTAPASSQLALQKTASPSAVTAAGQTITYSYLVSNTGNTTLTGVTAVDTAFSGTGTPPAISCPVTTLVPSASTTCTGTYTVTQADIDAGSVVNTATASGTPPTGPAVTSNPSTATVNAPASSQLALLKTASPSTVTAAGQTVTYSYLVTNTGNTTLTGVTAVDTAFSGTGTPPAITCPLTTLAPDASTTCTGTYTVTQADIDAGSVVNTAVASGTPPEGPAVSSDPSTATVNAPRDAQLVLEKTPSQTRVSSAGRSITYSYRITNTGNTTLTGVTATDTFFSGTGAPPVVTCPVTTLVPQATTTCTGTYVTTQADIDAGEIVNTAVASGAPPSGPAVTSNPSTATVIAPPEPQLALLKTASPSAVTAAGQTVTYSYLVTNTGNTTLTTLNVVDTAFSGRGAPPVVTCPVTTLAPQTSTTCTATYTVTQADIDAGSIVNTATATGTPPEGPAVTSNPSTATVTAQVAPGIALLKTASPSSVATAGQVVTYSYQVTNTGNATLADVSVADLSFSGTGLPRAILCPVTTLVPQASTTCTGTYTVTQADIDAGSIVNTATASGTPPSGPAVTSNPSTATVVATPIPGLTVNKTADPVTVTRTGQAVTYSHLVTNVGNVTLTGLNVRNTAFSGKGTPPVVTCPVTTLAPGASTTCTGTYTVVQADIDDGNIVNTATASGTPPEGPAVDSNPSTATVTVQADNQIALSKTASPSTVSAAGQVVTYSLLVTNIGNTTLTGVSAADTFFSGSGTPPVITCPVSSLAPGVSTTCTGSYAVTQADIDAGSIVNTAVATGTPPSGPAVGSDPSTATVTATSAPALTLTKSASPATVRAAGEVVTYSYLVTNTGNVALRGITAVDTAFSGKGTPPVVRCPVSSLAPGASTTCTGTYTLIQADIDDGNIVNTAVASGTPPEGPAVDSNPSTATVTVSPDPELSIVKSADPTTVSKAGQVVTYSYLVTNIGDVTFHDITVVDTSFSGTGRPPMIECPATSLAPGISMTCKATYVVTQADIDAGSIVDTATASGFPPEGPARTSDPSTATVRVASDPGLDLVKSADPSTVSKAGEKVTYSYRVTNTGNVTLDDITVVDTSFSGTGRPPVVTCPARSLAPGKSMTCTGTYTVTQADIDAGAIVNRAKVRGMPPWGLGVYSDPSAATVDVLADPELSLVKSADPATVTWAGQQVTYSFEVTNTGGVTLSDLRVHEEEFSGAGSLSKVSCPETSLAPEESTICTGTYTVTQADIDAGSIVNTAVAVGTAASVEGAVRSNRSTTTVTAVLAPGLTLVKSADPATVSGVGQEVTYSFAVANTGNVTVSGLVVDEVEFSGTGTLSAVTCPVTTLAPGRWTTCVGTYATTQDDASAGSVVNTAVAAGAIPSGQIVGSNASTTTVRVIWAVPLTPRFTCPRNRWLGNVANYGFTVFNNTPATTETSVTNDLSGILDDARFLGGKASDGALSNTPTALTWKGKLKPYQKALITYAVQLAKPSGDRKLVNNLVGPAPAGGVQVSPVRAPQTGTCQGANSARPIARPMAHPIARPMVANPAHPGRKHHGRGSGSPKAVKAVNRPARRRL